MFLIHVYSTCAIAFKYLPAVSTNSNILYKIWQYNYSYFTTMLCNSDINSRKLLNRDVKSLCSMACSSGVSSKFYFSSYSGSSQTSKGTFI